jgi:serine/threonine-protein kinase
LAHAARLCEIAGVQHEPQADAPAARLPVVSARGEVRAAAKTPRPSRTGRALPQRIGRYTLFWHIGRGGMADIFLASAATDLGASRLVVIKEVLPELAHVQHFADMLVSEAKIAARLDHANVVKVEDLGRDGALFIAMEYVEGVDLREMLRRCAKASVPVPVEFSLRIVGETLKALSYAHRFKGESGLACPVIHRDVSPSNVLLSFEGEVKLCDFGIARANALAEPAVSELIQGKAGYMSPEQARGEALDARADVFAAGIVLWELLAGRRLYKAKDGEPLLELAKRAEIPDVPARGLPHEAELLAIARRALERDREARYASAAVMLADLDELAMKARLVASPLRFGAWLAEHFGAEVWGPRRAGERVLRALAKGPAARIEALSVPAPPTVAPVPSALVAVDDDDPCDVMTPSTFGVIERAPEPSREVVEATVEPTLPMQLSAPVPDELEPRGVARAALVALLVMLLGVVVLFALRAGHLVRF